MNLPDQPSTFRPVRVERQHRVRVPQQYADPAGAVVEPGEVDHVVLADPQRPHDPHPVLVRHRPAAQQRRRRERQPGSGASHRHQAGPALAE